MKREGKVTAALRHWIVTQIEAGQNPEALLDLMMRQGWSEGTALEVMERTLRTRAAQLLAKKSASDHHK